MISSLSESQWYKVAKAAGYSFFSGFFGSLTLGMSGVISNTQGVDEAFIKSTIIAAVVAGFNTLFVFAKQLFTPVEK